MKHGRNRTRARGAILIMFSLTIFLIFGFMGLAFDLGRVYLAKNEAQSFVDSAALAAAVMLDGTTPARALAAVDGVYLTTNNAWKQYHFQTESFAGKYTVRFSKTGADDDFQTLAAGDDATGYRFAEVIATTDIPMYLSPVLTGNTISHPAARAVGAQVLKTWFDEGLAPFAPKAHCSDTGLYGFPPCTSGGLPIDPDYGMIACTPVPGLSDVPGTPASLCPQNTYYTLRWGSNVWSSSFKNYPPTVDTSGWCGGDVLQAGLKDQLATWYRSGDHWVDATGFFTAGSVNGTADLLKLLNGDMAATIVVGQQIPGWDGQNPQQISAFAKALNDKAALGPPGSFVTTPIIDPVTGKILTWKLFELYGTYNQNGGANWCAIYRGECTYGPCKGQVLSDGIYEIRLVK